MNKKQETFFDKFEKILTGNSQKEISNRKDNNVKDAEDKSGKENLEVLNGEEIKFNKLDIVELLDDVNEYKKGQKGKIIMVNPLYIMVEMFNDQEIQAKFRDKVIKVSSEQIKFIA